MIVNQENSAMVYLQCLNRYTSILIGIYHKTKDPIEKEITKQIYDECLRIIPKLKFYDC